MLAHSGAWTVYTPQSRHTCFCILDTTAHSRCSINTDRTSTQTGCAFAHAASCIPLICPALCSVHCGAGRRMRQLCPQGAHIPGEVTERAQRRRAYPAAFVQGPGGMDELSAGRDGQEGLPDRRNRSGALELSQNGERRGYHGKARGS